MRVSKYLLPTLREVPSEAEIPSHQLMLRAGLMRKLASGVYAFLPLGFKTLKNIEKIVNTFVEKRQCFRKNIKNVLSPHIVNHRKLPESYIQFLTFLNPIIHIF